METSAHHNPPLRPALACVELTSIARGVRTVDEMCKKAPVRVLESTTVCPGKYVIVIGGEVGDVEESLAAGRECGGSAVLDWVYLPHVHPEVVAAIGGGRVPEVRDALGVVETATVPAVIRAADAGVKGADVRLVEVRLADGLGGKGIVLFSGLVADVETAVEIGIASLESPGQLVRSVVIPKLHPAMWENVADASRFAARVLEQL